MSMELLLPILTILALSAMVIVVLTLFMGLFSMSRGGAFNARYGNKLMRYRVLFQAVAIALVGMLALGLGQ
jgi:hypothetical protein